MPSFVRALGLVGVSIGLTACGGAPPVSTAAQPPKPVASTTSKSHAPAPLIVEAAPAFVADPGNRLRTDLRAAGARRALVSPEPFRIADLPQGVVPEMLPVNQPADVTTSSDAGPELLVDWAALSSEAKLIRAQNGYTSVRVTLHNQALGRIRIGGREGAVTLDGAGGVYVTCGGEYRGRTMISPARWEWLSMEQGTMRLHIVNAWFDTQTCKASVVTRTEVSARALPGGLLYAFRECEGPTSETLAQALPCKREFVTFLGPRAQQVVASGVGGEARTAIGGFSRVSLPLRRGGGGSFMGRVDAPTLRNWLTATGSQSALQGEMVVGAEVVQGIDDPEPLAVAYSAPAPERSSSSFKRGRF
jgi:hypothetical protein